MIDLARENRAQTDATQRTLLAESYYGLSLAREVAAVRQDTYNGLRQHYENALKLEAAGMIDKAGRLFAQVNMDEAQRALEAAQKEVTVVESALCTLLNLEDSCKIEPTSSVHQLHASAQRRIRANHACRQPHAEPAIHSAEYRQAAATDRPKRLSAGHRPLR